MPRSNLIRQNTFPYHVYTRSNNKDWFTLSMEIVWRLFIESMKESNEAIPVDLHSFVLMNNHYHLLISTPNSDLDKFMEHLNKRFSQKLRKHSQMINHKFANRYKWTIVSADSYLYNIYRYIYQNPIRANICVNCQSYPYSSLRISPLEMKLKPHLDFNKHINWFETVPNHEFNQVIKTGLGKNTFGVSNRISKPILEELNQNKVM